MKQSLFHALVLAAGLWLAALPARADEPAQAEPSQETPAEKKLDAEALNLLHARINLADQIHQFADFDANIGLVHANGLGVDVALPDAALKAQLNLAEREGVTVTQVPDDSVGAKAGLKVHDVIIEVGGHGVGQITDLNQALEAADGKTVRIKFWRAGKQAEVEATPKKPEYARLKWSHALLSNLDNDLLVSAESYRIGVTLSEADETLRQQLRLAAGEGLVVTEVVDDSAAAKASIQTHDLLTMLDGKRLTTVEAINAQIQELKEKSVELRLLRNGKEFSLTIAARKTQEAAFADRPLLMWSSKICQNCHDAAHNTLAIRLGADFSAWTDGHHAKLFQYEKAYRAQVDAAQHAVAEAGTKAAPQQQIEALKAQLAEMQKTLMALEQAVQQPAKEEEKK
jgi:predicted metalloprotease with PDZ domain